MLDEEKGQPIPLKINKKFLTKKFSYDAPTPWQCTFQDPATPVMEGIIDLHHDIMFVLIVLVIMVA